MYRVLALTLVAWGDSGGGDPAATAAVSFGDVASGAIQQPLEASQAWWGAGVRTHLDP